MCAPWVTRHTSIRYSSSCHTRVNMGAFCLHRHPVSVNCLYHWGMVLSVGGSFAYFARHARCTVTTDLLCDIPTHQTTSPQERPFSHYIHSHRLAAEMWTTITTTYWGNFFFLSCSFYLYRFRKYVSIAFTIIHFYNPEFHKKRSVFSVSRIISSTQWRRLENYISLAFQLIANTFTTGL